MSEIACISDRLELPIFRIPFQYRWTDIIVKVLNEMDRLSEIENTLMRDKSFLAEIDNMGALLQVLSSRVDRPIYFSTYSTNTGTMLWPSCKVSLKPGQTAEDYKNSKIETTRFLCGSSDFVGIREEKRFFNGITYSRIYSTHPPNAVELHVISAYADQKLTSSEEKFIMRGLLALKVLMAEQARLSNQQHSEISQTLERLLLGSYSDPKIITQTLRKWDLTEIIPCRIGVIPVQNANSKLIGYTDVPYRFSCKIGNLHVLLIPWETRIDFEESNTTMELIKKYNVPVALGSIAETLEDIHASFNDAQRVMAYMQKIGFGNKVIIYEEIVLNILLCEIVESDDASRIWQKYWRPLKTVKPSLRVKLEEFLSCLVECGFNIAECSERLGIHYNTARNYAESIERILNLSLRDFNSQVCILIAKNIDFPLRQSSLSELCVSSKRL
ncbi:MAG: helix-turn-helix domain-containing protein [Synergistaceae bacterium]|jgi:hypothetical protein|nr:helix-turn-helix domain-containing protein [Synergistaceae bacterium]